MPCNSILHICALFHIPGTMGITGMFSVDWFRIGGLMHLNNFRMLRGSGARGLNASFKVTNAKSVRVTVTTHFIAKPAAYYVCIMRGVSASEVIHSTV